MKWKTLGHVFEGVARVVYPPAGTIIDGAKAIKAAHGEDRAAALLEEIDTSLVTAGDLSGKAALADPAVRALARKWAQDGLELHDLIEQTKKAITNRPATAAELGAPAGSTGD
jgi:hypothetical protein